MVKTDKKVPVFKFIGFLSLNVISSLINLLDIVFTVSLISLKIKMVTSFYLEDEFVPKLLCFLAVRNKKVDDPLHNPTRVRLARMHPG